ncbi:MAG: hypothetical protein NVS9B10_17100 [Nevskia sp.]
MSARLHEAAGASRSRLLAALDRAADLGAAAALALLFAPVILAALAALIGSGGPVIFRQPRIGRGGRPFTVYKFRTMWPDAVQRLDALLAADPALNAEWRANFKLRRDPRVTRLGRILRRTSLDELPQLWNIAKGDMRLVGPRPVEPCEMARYGRHARHYLASKPGLTGLWQVSGRSAISYQRRIVLDAYYARHRGLALDLAIVARTVGVVLLGRGAC